MYSSIGGLLIFYLSNSDNNRYIVCRALLNQRPLNQALNSWADHFDILNLDLLVNVFDTYNQKLLEEVTPFNNELLIHERFLVSKGRFFSDLNQFIDDLNQEAQNKSISSVTKVLNSSSCVIPNNFIKVSCIGIIAPINQLRENLNVRGFFHSWKNRPCSNVRMVVSMDDFNIINSYNFIIRGLLDFYGLAENFSSLNSFIVQLNQSCVFTLARKHNNSSSWVLNNYGGSDLKVFSSNGTFVQLVTELELNKRSNSQSFFSCGLDLDKLLDVCLYYPYSI